MVVFKMEKPTREEILKLMDDKKDIENQIEQHRAVLLSNNIGMTEPLVDDQGFPLSNVDVYNVRNARHKIICLTNDYKVLMSMIEKKMEQYWKSNDSSPSSSTNDLQSLQSTVTSLTIENQEMNSPIAIVNIVSDDSPAQQAGIQLNDKILEFGTVNSSNFKSLSDISNVVKHSIGIPIKVKVLRNNFETIELELIPKQWPGKGLIGCNIVPYESVER